MSLTLFLDKLKSRKQQIIVEEQKGLNVIVYDNTETEPDTIFEWPLQAQALIHDEAKRGSLTWWWKIGSILQMAKQNADIVIEAEDWEGALANVLDEANGKRINNLQFWGHGNAGRMYMNGVPVTVNNFSLTNKRNLIDDFLHELRLLLSPSSYVWFRGCSCFFGETGQRFALGARDFFNCNIVSHTYIIHALQSGTHILGPGDQISWTTSEGGVTEETGMSKLGEPNTILATQFWPGGKNK